MSTFWSEPVIVGEVVYPPGGSFGPRRQTSLQLVLMHYGHVTVWIDGEKHFAPAHTIFLLFPDHEERFAFAEETQTWHTWLNVPASSVDEACLQRLRQLSWSLPLSPALHQLMREALAAQHTALPTAHQLLMALGLQMLWRYLGEGELQATHAARRAYPAVEMAQQFMLTHLAEALTLETLAQATAVSPAHLIRLFQAQLQTTPMAYLWQLRVKRGLELLEQTGMSVGAIAYQCGFQSRFHFSRRIHEATGYAPLAIRQRSWQRTHPPD